MRKVWNLRMPNMVAIEALSPDVSFVRAVKFD